MGHFYIGVIVKENDHFYGHFPVMFFGKIPRLKMVGVGWHKRCMLCPNLVITRCSIKEMCCIIYSFRIKLFVFLDQYLTIVSSTE